jgi:flavin reductase (DIM6/NTAB) family NADH-FMN oxidoreductase RutF
MIYNLNKLEKTDIYKLMSNLVIPRPIAWVSSKSKEDILNIAPFSYFTPLSSSPATLLISIGHKPNKEPKDTLKNLRDTKKCSIVIATTNQLQDMHNSATPLEHNISEFKEFDIKTISINPEYPNIPKNSKVAFFCEYLQEVDLKNSKTIPVIVEVKEIFVDDSLVLDKEKIRVSFKEAIARVGASYFSLGEELEVK